MNANEKLRQNLVGAIWSLLNILRDPELQAMCWIERKDLHAMEDVLEDLSGHIEGLPEWSFAQSLSYVYQSFGIVAANAILPVYVAVEECQPVLPKTLDDFKTFELTQEWTKVCDFAQAAFEVIDRLVDKDEGGIPILYDPSTWDTQSKPS